MLTKSLEISLSVYGEQHLATVTPYNNLGHLYSKLGDHQKAIEMLTKSLEIRRSVYGEQHSATAISYNNLRQLYSNLEDLRKP